MRASHCLSWCFFLLLLLFLFNCYLFFCTWHLEHFNLHTNVFVESRGGCMWYFIIIISPMFYNYCTCTAIKLNCVNASCCVTKKPVCAAPGCGCQVTWWAGLDLFRVLEYLHHLYSRLQRATQYDVDLINLGTMWSELNRSPWASMHKNKTSSASFLSEISNFLIDYLWSQHHNNSHPVTCLTLWQSTTVLEPRTKTSPHFSHDGYLLSGTAKKLHSV